MKRVLVDSPLTPTKKRNLGLNNHFDKRSNTPRHVPNKIFVCGNNKMGQLSMPATAERTAVFTQCTVADISDKFLSIRLVSCGFHSTLIVTQNNELYSCGENYYGQLGLGHNEHEDHFKPVNYLEFYDKTITALCCGGTHTIVQTDDGSLHVAGNNTNGQLGLGFSSYQLKFRKIETVPEKVWQVTCGSSHTVFRSVSNKLYSCGWNDDGQLCLELINFDIPILDVKCGNYHTLVLTSNGDLYSSGYNFYGQLGQGHNDTQSSLSKVITNQPIYRIFACSAHTIIQASDTALYACGYNGTGQLGIGIIHDRINVLARCRPFSRNQVKDVACRFGNHSLVLTENNELFATGKNDSGQLGIGKSEDTNVFTPVLSGFTSQDVIVSVHCGMYHSVVITRCVFDEISKIERLDNYVPYDDLDFVYDT